MGWITEEGTGIRKYISIKLGFVFLVFFALLCLSRCAF